MAGQRDAASQASMLCCAPQGTIAELQSLPNALLSARDLQQTRMGLEGIERSPRMAALENEDILFCMSSFSEFELY